MTTKMNLNGTTRKALVAAIAEITGDQPIYRKVPTCNYDIGEITVTKDGSIVCPDRSDILTALTAAGFCSATFPVIVHFATRPRRKSSEQTRKPSALQQKQKILLQWLGETFKVSSP